MPCSFGILVLYVLCLPHKIATGRLCQRERWALNKKGFGVNHLVFYNKRDFNLEIYVWAHPQEQSSGFEQQKRIQSGNICLGPPSRATSPPPMHTPHDCIKDRALACTPTHCSSPEPPAQCSQLSRLLQLNVDWLISSVSQVVHKLEVFAEEQALPDLLLAEVLEQLLEVCSCCHVQLCSRSF